jgi:phosphoglycerate transporter family protein
MLKRIMTAIKAQPHIEPIKDPKEIKRVYKHYRVRMLYTMMAGYGAFYLVRKNFSMAMPSFLHDFGATKTDLGIILSVFSIIYGVGKFFNGVLADRANPRYFMAIGLICSAITNIIFGFSTGLMTIGIFWLFNAWFQAMGWPPCARMLTHWYGHKELGTMWGIWNASHQLGGAGIMILAGYLIPRYGWRSAFYVPAILCILIALFLINRLRDTPQSIGLPPIEEYRGEAKKICDSHEDTASSFKEIFMKYILPNKYLWFLCFANFFVYIVRIGLLDWAPTYLVEVKGSKLNIAGFQVATFEIAGIFGAFIAGYMSDKIFKGKRGPVNVLYMVLLVFSLFYFWKVPAGHEWLDCFALFAVGFLVYGPQMLVGVAAADVASKKASATATGLTGTFGYLGSTVCGVGTGVIIDKYGWNGGFMFYLAATLIAVILFLFTWNAKAVMEEGGAKAC